MLEDDLLDYDLKDDVLEGEQEQKREGSAFDKFDPANPESVFEMSTEKFEALTADPKFKEYLQKGGYTPSKLRALRERMKKAEEKKEEEEDPLLIKKAPSPSKKAPE